MSADSKTPTSTLTLESSIELSLSHISSHPSIYTSPTPEDLDLYTMLPPLLRSKYPSNDHGRIPDFLKAYVLLNHVEDDCERLRILGKDFSKDNKLRPPSDIHAYMPGVGGSGPFLDPSSVPFCEEITSKMDIITKEFATVLDHLSNDESDGVGFKSLTSMNYQSGWSTLCTHVNGHPSPTFPSHLTPTLSEILSKIPVAGRICGFNRQMPSSGIIEHTDGNNMWLTLQVPLSCSPGKASITNGGVKRTYKVNEPMLYDTTFLHSTYNEGAEDRVVLHVDFWNTLDMTADEIMGMTYIYDLMGMYRGAMY